MDDFDQREAVEAERRGAKMKAHEWAERLRAIPTLELAMRVEAMGGWTNVILLSPASLNAGADIKLAWVGASDEDEGRIYAKLYLNPYDHIHPLCWYVYGIRRRQS